MTRPKIPKSASAPISAKGKHGSKRSISDIFDEFYSKKVATIQKTGNSHPNVFRSMRPPRQKAKDYDIDQEYAVLQKGPLKLRCAITEAKYDWHPADYSPKIFEKIIKRKQHGRAPLEDLLDETWNKVVDMQQRRIAAFNKKKFKEARIKCKSELKRRGQLILRVLGPDWYQELSPKQVKVVDKLHLCIRYDIKHNTIKQTVDNLSELGVVLDQNSKKIRYALSHCCSCPVEFLLKFYSILNPKRTAYSVNDRLLLSAVVRLTITDTLKELHIRIPSPPRKEPVSKPKIKPVKSEKNISPYLIPFTFKPIEWNNKNYFKRDREYPHNEYFSYRRELICRLIMLCTETDLVLSVEESSADKTESKHKADKKNKNECILAAIPSKTNTDSSSSQYLEGFAAIETELVKEWLTAQRIYNELFLDTKCVPALHKPSVFIPCFMQKAEDPPSKTEVETKIAPTTKPEVNDVQNVTYIEAEDDTESSGDNSEIAKFCEKHEIIGLVCSEDVEEQEVEEQKGSFLECVCGGNGISDLNDDNCALKQSVAELNDDIASTFDEINKSTSEMDDLNKENKDRLCKAALPGCSKCEAASRKIKLDLENEELPEEQPKENNCWCKDKVLEKINTSLCPCDRCVADREEANTKRIKIFAGLKEEEDGPTVNIITGVKTEQICTCMEKYESRWKSYEERVEVKKAQEALQSFKDKYVITGVTMDCEGKPVYILSSVEPKPECECFKKLKEQEEENERIAQKPPLPDSCNKYLISGVHSTPEGNVFIINGLKKNCKCMDIYNTFTNKHATCLKLFEEYMKKIQYDTEEYMSEIADTYTEFIPDVNDFEQEEIELNVSAMDNFEEEDENCFDSCALEELSNSILNEMECYYQEGQEGESKLSCCPVEELPEPCSLGPIPSCKLAPSPEISTESITEEIELKRYIILEEIPCCSEKQQEILKKALDSLAEDGFPLAKLPDVHRLPHFKLWLQMRCRKFWTQEEKDKFIPRSRMYWGHIDVSRKNVKIPTKDFLKEELEKQNWGYAKLIKKTNSSITRDYYSKLKVESINYARNLFPTLFTNEFPTKAFRDVFFAYMPSKVNNVLPFRMWLAHDFRNQELLRRKRCG